MRNENQETLNYFWKKLCSSTLHLFDQKYSNVKYYYNSSFLQYFNIFEYLFLWWQSFTAS